MPWGNGSAATSLLEPPAAEQEVPGERPPFSAGTYELLALLIATIGVLGLCNNLLVLVLYYKFKRLRTPTNLFLVNISLSDLLVSVFGVSLTFMSCLRSRWVWDAAGCVWDGFSNSLFGGCCPSFPLLSPTAAPSARPSPMEGLGTESCVFCGKCLSLWVRNVHSFSSGADRKLMVYSKRAILQQEGCSLPKCLDFSVYKTIPNMVAP